MKGIETNVEDHLCGKLTNRRDKSKRRQKKRKRSNTIAILFWFWLFSQCLNISGHHITSILFWWFVSQYLNISIPQPLNLSKGGRRREECLTQLPSCFSQYLNLLISQYLNLSISQSVNISISQYLKRRQEEIKGLKMTAILFWFWLVCTMHMWVQKHRLPPVILTGEEVNI